MGTDINIKKRIAVQEESVTITSDVNSINFTGAGVNTFTVGDDVTVNIPGSIGATVYYLNETITQAPYKEFSSIPTAAVEQTIATAVGVGATVTIQSFQTPSGVPNTTNIPAGLWQFYLHFSGTFGDSWDVYAEVYKRDLGGIETLLLTTDVIPTTALSAIPTMILTDGVFPASTVLTTDRIVVKVLATNTGVAGQTITFHTEGSTNYSVGTTTLNQIVPTGAVTSVTGTAPVVSSGGTTPAISMAQANSITDGYLSSADWTLFSYNNQIQDEGVNVTQRTTVDFQGAGVSVADSGGKTVVTIPGSSSGRFGIANSAGVYTYYTTLTLAMAAATSGQTIEFFTDYTETGAVTITLKNGVNINGNGHTYTLDTATTTTAFIDGGVSVEMLFSNITLIRKGAGSGIVIGLSVSGNRIVGNSTFIKVESPTSTGIANYGGAVFSGYISGFTISCSGLNSAGISLIRANIDSCNVIASGSANGIAVNIGAITNSYGESLGSGAGIRSAGAAYISNCSGKGNTGIGIDAGSNVYNSTGVSSGNIGIYSPFVSITNCTGISSSSYGIWGLEMYNCTAISSGNIAIFSQNGVAYNCTAISTVNASFNIFNSTKVYNSTLITNSGNSTVYTAIATTYATLKNCSIINNWNNAAGHGVDANAVLVVNGCSIKVANASANCIYSASPVTMKYAQNTFEGATVSVNANVTQGMINTDDAYGNITI